MPIPTETVANSYLRGIADVRIKDDAVLLVKFDDKDTIYEIPYVESEVGNVTDGKYRVSLSSDGSKLFGITPFEGTFVVRYVGMVTQEGQIPTPKLIRGGLRKSKDGRGSWTAPDYMAFTVLLRVVSEKNKRMTIPYQLTYSFKQYQETNETLIPLGNKMLDKTAEFLQMAGMDFNLDSIPFSDNVLPFLDDFFSDKNTKFQIVLKNGYIDSVAQLPPAIVEE